MRVREVVAKLRSHYGAPQPLPTANPFELVLWDNVKSTFAAKLRECARIAASEPGGNLDSVMRLPLEQARRALRRFPGIGVRLAQQAHLLLHHHGQTLCKRR